MSLLTGDRGRRLRAEGWRDARCAGCLREILVRGEGTPCCSVACGHVLTERERLAQS